MNLNKNLFPIEWENKKENSTVLFTGKTSLFLYEIIEKPKNYKVCFSHIKFPDDKIVLKKIPKEVLDFEEETKAICEEHYKDFLIETLNEVIRNNKIVKDVKEELDEKSKKIEDVYTKFVKPALDDTKTVFKMAEMAFGMMKSQKRENG